MDVDLWMSIALYLVLLVCSAFFSGSESAFFSILPADLRKLKKMSDSAPARRVVLLLENPRRLLTSILIGNTIVNVAAATVAALLSGRMLPAEWMGGLGLLLVIFCVTLSILFFSEILPKIVAVKSAVAFAKRVAFPLQIFLYLTFPLSFIFENITRGIIKLFGIHKEIPFVNAEELKTLIEVGEEKGTLDQVEREMIHSIFEFRETMVKEIMVPRMDMLCLEKTTSVDEVLTHVKAKGHSRIPVYEDKVDNIIGILYVKDLLPFLVTQKNMPNLSALVRKAYFIPESKQIDELLKEFQQERLHMAVVVDEYGGTAGLITLEDIIEEIVGEIRDEYDREIPLVRKLDDLTWTADGKINIEELNEAVSLDLPTEEDFESLGGFLFNELGRIPQEQDSVVFESIRFIIEQVKRQRITSVRIVMPAPDPNGQEEGNPD